jgi:ribosomal protein L29
MTLKSSELQGMSLPELQEKLSELKSNVFRARAEIVTKGGSKNTKLIGTIKSDIARMMDAISTKRRLEGQNVSAKVTRKEVTVDAGGKDIEKEKRKSPKKTQKRAPVKGTRKTKSTKPTKSTD